MNEHSNAKMVRVRIGCNDGCNVTFRRAPADSTDAFILETEPADGGGVGMSELDARQLMLSIKKMLDAQEETA